MNISKKKYKGLVCALTLATTFSIFSEEVYADSELLEGEISAGTAVTTEDMVMPAQEPAAVEDSQATDRQAIWLEERPSDATVVKWSEEFEGKTIVAIEYEGLSEDIKKTIEASTTSKPGDKYTLSLLEQDVEGIYETGYFYDLYPTFKTVPEGVILVYHLFETPVLTAVTLEGNTAIEPTDKLMGKMQLKAGDRLNRKALHEDVVALQKQYVSDGYIMAKIHDMAVGDDGKLLIKINEGILEGYKVRGLTKTKERVVLREMRSQVGAPLNKKDVLRSYQRLTNLGYFESVDIKPSPGVEPNACVLDVNVVEKNTGMFSIGGGYSTSDGFLASISVGDSNFRGIGDAVNLTFGMSGNAKDNRGYSFSYRRPWLDKKETSGSFRIYNRTFEYNEYSIEDTLIEEFMRKNSGFEIGVSRPQSEYSTNSIMLRNKNDNYELHKSGTDRSSWYEWQEDNFGLTRSIYLQHATDTRDNYMYPTQGSRAVLGYELAGFGGDFNYHKITMEDAHYIPLGNEFVVAIRGRYGYANTTLPSIAQFKLGGQDTIRGYRDDIFRGNAMFVGNLELRFPLSNKVKGAIFTDFGSAWESGFLPEKPHGSIGVGAMMDTPVGPVRIDYGHGSQGNKFHFNIGTTF